ncbi:MAG TPA: DUF2283 domain-containing protein [bacterium]|nr:DUF2283 domain-containing protein [bacterium]HOL92710.1 DUF2283 domain-containing protein [bacterium]HPO99075.1 DUF2283 domain-containing protein [bacterium]
MTRKLTRYIQLRPINSDEAANQDLPEGITADFGPDGLLSGIEILDASRILGKEREKVDVELTPIVK